MITKREYIGMVGILLAYFPVYFFTYAATDDYVNIYNVLTNQYGNGIWEIKCGRPIYAIFIIVAEFFATSINDLIFFRLFCVLSICLLFMLMYRFFINIKILKTFESFIISFCLCLIPAFQVYASWFVCYPFVISVILSIESFWIVTNDKIRYNNAVSIFLLICSFALYQPAAMSFVFFACCHMMASKKINIFFYAKIFVISCLGMISALILAKYIPSYFFNYSNPRADISINIVNRINWFIFEPLKNAFFNYNINNEVEYLIFSICIIGVGLYKLCRNKKKYKIILVTCSLILSYSPSLLLIDNWSPYRSLIVVEMFTCMFFCMGFVSIFKKYGAILLVSILVCVNIYNSYYGYVIPQQKDYEIVKKYISLYVDKNFVGKVILDTSNEPWCRSTPCRYDEFGISSSKVEWAIPGMLKQIRQETGKNYQVKGDCSEQLTIVIHQ